MEAADIIAAGGASCRCKGNGGRERQRSGALALFMAVLNPRHGTDRQKLIWERTVHAGSAVMTWIT